VSVVTKQARRRWALVAAGVTVLICLPAVTAVATSFITGLNSENASTPVPRVLIQRALASADVPYSGLAQSTGTLGLPDLPQLGDVAAELGGTTRTRVWWASDQAWRVAVLSSTGEQDVYGDHGRTVLWDYEQARLTEVIGSSPVRFPRADDLLPPQAARRLLGGLGPGDRIEALPGRRSVAGVRAEGVRIVPGDSRSTIGHADLWVDPDHGLPLAVDVVDVKGTTAVRSQFTDLDLTVPSSSAVQVPSAPGATHDVTAAPDLAGRLQRFDFFRLPDSLAGVTSSAPIVGGTATYGTGLVRFVVLPLPGQLAGLVLDATRTGGGTDLKLTGGEALLISSGLVNVVVVRSDSGRRAFLITGLVSADLLSTATQQLLEFRPQRPPGVSR
jgi:hypothetical protein